VRRFRNVDLLGELGVGNSPCERGGVKDIPCVEGAKDKLIEF